MSSHNSESYPSRLHWSSLVSTFLGIGYWPWGPGTLAALVSAPFWWWISQTCSWWIYLCVLLGVILLGLVASGFYLKNASDTDPSQIVIDEVVGLGMAYAFLTFGWIGAVCGFVLFRIFDIWKPWPVNVIDRNCHGAWGVMLDDVAAGAMVCIILQLARMLL